ncbi:CAP domain-containing protein [Neobacillus cucumis]|uniref:CAP domain-containing protein n=1 Tax=Neobacillus cucumis TaxID=1740721 RepID=UPI00203EC703|nr:CAP domain-containing protein [Neobacillus cucumis]MCM3725506.1 CAP domain-containing protein [Neobacillus cucumis]
MIKKPVGLLLTAFLTMGLAACNNDNRNDINDRTDNRVGFDTNDRNNRIVNVRNNRDNGIDHNGPLTEDYSNRNNNEPDLDTNRYNDKRKIKKNNDDTVSSYYTNLNSSQYPHTQAVLVRDAKYQYITVDPRQKNWFQFGFIQPGQTNTQQQRPAAQAPAQQQTTRQAPNQAPAQQATPVPRQQQTQAPSGAAQNQNNTVTSGSVSQYVQQVIDLTNQQRTKNGLPALKADTQLSGVAQKKAVDMQQNHYFSHTSPTYGSPFDMMRDFGVTYKSAGENIAQGQRTPQEVVTAWMNSEGHRKNILSANFTHIGVGFEQTGKNWSQMFIGK